ncbi:hypothetical protein KS4_16540 [Poriferisphaera corsica]|uniref:DUF192 domain-containing protein n=1 Tax=Poriferisphaera corsica TaxID=2528020 RepID=A0A517YTU3_9BACT|nr:DUF192 domain-containing protein [Poriferisphaera corsica]QDU33602.1 hypothetical protein KS4_16540 [Poriferisphaera corsica]
MKQITQVPMLLILLMALLHVSCSSQPVPSPQDPIKVQIKDQTYTLELAITPQQRFQGLSDRETMPTDQGMLFVFPYPQIQNFVMRRCYFPIDIIYLDPSGRVITTHNMQTVPFDTPEFELPRYSSRYPAQFAIELHGGELEKLHLKEGDLIPLPLQSLKKLAQ